MQEYNFRYYLRHVFYKQLKTLGVTFPVILFVDNHASHFSSEISETCDELGIILICLYPNSTHIIQPLDIAVFRPFKCAWRQMIGDKSIVVKNSNFGELLKECVERYHQNSWAISGFKAAGIYPWCASNINFEKIKDGCTRKKTCDEKKIWVQDVINNWKATHKPAEHFDVRKLNATTSFTDQLPQSVDVMTNQMNEALNNQLSGAYLLNCDSMMPLNQLDNIQFDSQSLENQSATPESLNDDVEVIFTSQASSVDKCPEFSFFCDDELTQDCFNLPNHSDNVNQFGSQKLKNQSATPESLNDDVEVIVTSQPSSVLINQSNVLQNTTSPEFSLFCDDEMAQNYFNLPNNQLDNIDFQKYLDYCKNNDSVSHSGRFNIPEECKLPQDIRAPQCQDYSLDLTIETVKARHYEKRTVNEQTPFEKLSILYGDQLTKYLNRHFLPTTTEEDLLYRIVQKFRPQESIEDVLDLPPGVFRKNKKNNRKQPYMINGPEFKNFKSKTEEEKNLKVLEKETEMNEKRKLKAQLAKEKAEETKKRADLKLKEDLEKAEKLKEKRIQKQKQNK